MYNITPTFEDKASLLFNYHSATFGLIFSIIGFISLLVLYPKIDFISHTYYINDTAEKTAEIFNVTESNCSINDKVIMNIHYYYTINDKKMEGNSFSADRKYEIGQSFPIQYLVKNPEQSRIVNTSNSPYGFWTFLFILIFPGIGIYSLFVGMKKVNKSISILENFDLTTGHLEHVKKTKVEINDSPIYKLYYSYKYYNKNYENITETLKPDSFKKEEMVVVSQNDISESVLLNALPIDIILMIKKITK